MQEKVKTISATRAAPVRNGNGMINYDYPLHNYFFIFYIFFGSALLLMHLRIIEVIRRSSYLWKRSAYRFIFYGSFADAVNCGVQVALVAATTLTPVIHPTANWLLGALFQITYDVELPTILILAVNRFVAIVFPKKLDVIFHKWATNIMLLSCLLFGAINGAFLLSGEIRSLWDPQIPTFFFTNETTFIAVLVRSVDLYLSELVVITSFILYIIIVAYLVYNRKSYTPSNVELPLLLHSFQTLIFAGLLLYFWYYPISNTPLYFHVFNALVILRFGIAAISLLITNRTIRNGFLQWRRSDTAKVAVISHVPHQSTRTIRNGFLQWRRSDTAKVTVISHVPYHSTRKCFPKTV